MGVLIASGKSHELKPVEGMEGVFACDVFQEVKGATASAGRSKAEKGASYLFELPIDDFAYIISGSLKYEVEGKTLVAREGDFVHVQKGTTVQISTDEGFEAIFFMIPSTSSF